MRFAPRLVVIPKKLSLEIIKEECLAELSIHRVRVIALKKKEILQRISFIGIEYFLNWFLNAFQKKIRVQEKHCTSV